MNDEKRFREFSLAFYRRPGVEHALLTLQDEHGLEVNLILLCLFAASEEYPPFDEEAFGPFGHIAARWSQAAVEPLRRARRGLKTMLPDERAAALREKVKALELEAEFAMQDALVAALRERGVPEPSGGFARTTAAHNLQAYLVNKGMALGATRERLFQLLLDNACGGAVGGP